MCGSWFTAGQRWRDDRRPCFSCAAGKRHAGVCVSEPRSQINNRLQMTSSFVFQRFGDKDQRTASSALRPPKPDAHLLPEEVQAVHVREEQLLEEEEAAAAVSLRRSADDSPPTRRQLPVRGHLLRASAAEPRCRLGEEEQALLPDQRAGGSAAEAELHRRAGRARSRGVPRQGEGAELESPSKSC